MGIQNRGISGDGEVFEGLERKKIVAGEIEHYIKVAKAIEKTIEVEGRVEVAMNFRC
jgi:hypothetical protein